MRRLVNTPDKDGIVPVAPTNDPNFIDAFADNWPEISRQKKWLETLDAHPRFNVIIAVDIDDPRAEYFSGMIDVGVSFARNIAATYGKKPFACSPANRDLITTILRRIDKEAALTLLQASDNAISLIMVSGGKIAVLPLPAP